MGQTQAKPEAHPSHTDSLDQASLQADGSMEQKANLFLYCKNLGGSSNSNRNVKILKFVPNAYKHWAVVVEYLDQDGVVDFRELYEAGADPNDGLLKATHCAHSKAREKVWMDSPGAKKIPYGTITISQDKAIAFCEEVTARKQKYIALEENCQTFVNEFITTVTIIEQSFNLPLSVSRVRGVLGRLSETSRASLTNLSCGAVVKEITGDLIFKEIIEDASVYAIKKVNASDALMKKFMEDIGTNLVVSASGEIVENLMNACRGAVSWWQLIQIPVEILTKIFLQKVGCDKIQAYGGSKLASVVTAGTVGGIVGGPFGIVLSIAFWIGAEIFTYFFRKLMEKIVGDRFTGFFGESQSEELARRICNWIKAKIELGLFYGLGWMKDYIDSTQNVTKKIL